MRTVSKILLASLLSIVTVSSVLSQDLSGKIALINVVISEDLPEISQNVVSDLVRYEFFRNENFSIMSRIKTEETLIQEGMLLSTINDLNDAFIAASILQADKMIFGNLSKVKDKLLVLELVFYDVAGKSEIHKVKVGCKSDFNTMSLYGFKISVEMMVDENLTPTPDNPDIVVGYDLEELIRELSGVSTQVVQEVDETEDTSAPVQIIDMFFADSEPQMLNTTELDYLHSIMSSGSIEADIFVKNTAYVFMEYVVDEVGFVADIAIIDVNPAGVGIESASENILRDIQFRPGLFKSEQVRTRVRKKFYFPSTLPQDQLSQPAAGNTNTVAENVGIIPIGNASTPPSSSVANVDSQSPEVNSNQQQRNNNDPVVQPETTPEVLTEPARTVDPDGLYDYFEIDSKPAIVGGKEAIFRYMIQNQVYPSEARAAGVQGMAIIEFIVTPEGKAEGTKVFQVRPDGYGFGEAGVKAINAMNFTPGSHQGQTVRVRMRQDIRFDL